jgi:alanine racemase
VPEPSGTRRPAWAEIDVAAARHNAALLKAMCAPARLCAVVKANGYGHGAVPMALAALDGGAEWLAVALVEEGVALRDAGISAPILLLSQPGPDGVEEAVAQGLTPTLYRSDGVDAAERAARAQRRVAPVHLKVDTGMHRVGAPAADAMALARRIADSPHLSLEGLYTHFPVADEDDQDDFTAGQIDQLEKVRAEMAGAGIQPALVHASNSAGALAHPGSRLDLVRCGLALYGYSPRGDGADLRPVMSLKARVAHVQTLEAGERISYGRRYAMPHRGRVATVPLGYADGVPRALSATGGQVLIGGRRRPIAGTVTMDQLMVDCGPDDDVAIGDEVVLIGRQGDELIGADEWAVRLGTITWEVLCGIGPRVPRVLVGQ